jgi:hypothetical protein
MPDLVSPKLEMPKQELPPTEESGVEADEKAREQLDKTQETFLEEAALETAPSTPIEQAPIGATPVPAVVVKDDDQVSIEKILEEGLGPYYTTLPETAKPIFRKKGEQAATEIAGMVRTLKIKVKRVLTLIRDWLLTIPNVNKFFLEQEAKIKTDKIVELVKARKEERMQKP